MSRYHTELTDLYETSMISDERVQSLTKRWGEINRTPDGSRDHEIAGVMSEMRSVAAEYKEDADTDDSDPDPTSDNTNARATGDEDLGDSEGDEGDDSDVDEEPTARERLKNSPEASPVGSTGSVSNINPDNMTPMQKMTAHEKGLKPPGL
jgi:hypothetical protein